MVNVNIVIYSLTAVIIISLISLVGVLTLTIKEKTIKAISSVLVSFAVGALLGDAFIHLIPEAFDLNWYKGTVSLTLISGILTFFVLEKFVRWHHGHVHSEKEKENLPVATMNIIGDGVHNFIDGIVIASSFMAGPAIGVSTALAVILHEIPQEIGDFAVLIHSGWKVKKALLYNFLTGLTSIVGAILALIFGSQIFSDNFLAYSIPFAAGGFIYIALSDLIPDLHEKVDIKNSLTQIIFILLGIIIMIALLAVDL